MSSTIFTKIQTAVNSGKLNEPFSVSDVNAVTNALINSPSFLSKHAKNNPKNYTVYFKRVKRGYYKIA